MRLSRFAWSHSLYSAQNCATTLHRCQPLRRQRFNGKDVHEWLQHSRTSCNYLHTREHSLTTCSQGAVPHYADSGLDRASHIRKDAAKLEQLERSPHAKLVLLHAHSGLLSRLPDVDAEDSRAPKWQAAAVHAASVPEALIDNRVGKIFLGLDQERPFFAASVTPEGASAILQQHDKAEWVELRREGGPFLHGKDAALMAYAAGMVSWARNSLYSGVTGEPLQPLQGGHARGSATVRPLFTRIDPAVIMAVTCGDWILLGRQARWSRGRFSLLAGFCEIGETLEQAVARETFEEAGVVVLPGSVQYHSSQPWPFPQSLMIGFTAEAAAAPQPEADMLQKRFEESERQDQQPQPAEISAVFDRMPAQPAVDNDELEAAFWFHRSSVSAAMTGSLPAGIAFTIPGPHALAHTIITEWAQLGCQESSTVEAWQMEIPDVEIDIGRFKYVLLRVASRESPASKLVVRGDRSKAYHADILEAVRTDLQAYNLKVEVLGGGRIENSVEQISVFGYSSAFGPAWHELTAALLRRAYPMAVITTSDMGY